MMSDTVQLALISSLPGFIAACVAAYVSILNNKKGRETSIKINETDVKVDNVITKSDNLIEKTVQIHTLTNSNLSKVTAANEVLSAKLEELQKTVKMMMDDKMIAGTALIKADQQLTNVADRAGYRGRDNQYNDRYYDRPQPVRRRKVVKRKNSK